MTESDDLRDLEPGAERRPWRALVRLAALFVILIVLPMLLLAATMASALHPEGCGGG